MSSAQQKQPSLAETVSGYQTIISLVPLNSMSFVKVLDLNPDRWYLKVYHSSGGLGTPVLPGPIPAGTDAVTFTAEPQSEWKFRDCPSIVTGEFFARGGAGENLFIIESIYKRGR